MKDPTKIFEEIESMELDVRMNVISGISHFVEYAIEQPEFKKLVTFVYFYSGANHGLIIENRLIKLLSQSPTPGYEHPQDVAMAFYLLVLHQLHSPYSHELAQTLARYPHGNWSVAVGERIVLKRAVNPDREKTLWKLVDLEKIFWKFVDNAILHPCLAFPWEPKIIQEAHIWASKQYKEYTP